MCSHFTVSQQSDSVMCISIFFRFFSIIGYYKILNIVPVLYSRTSLFMSHMVVYIWGLPGGGSGKEAACQCRRHKRLRFNPRVGKIP